MKTEEEKEKLLDEMVKELDPDGTFLDECQGVVEERFGKELICGKCGTKQLMHKIPYGKKKEEFSWWCPNCKDKISRSAVKIMQEGEKPTT